MPKRFKNYKFALKSLINPETGATVAPAAGTALANFQEYMAGQRRVSYTRDTTSNPGELIKVAINPFGLPLSATSLVKVFFSKRASDLTTLGATKGACNHQSTDGVLLELNRFIPAKAVVFIEGGTPSNPTPKSQITGVEYKAVAGSSYTLPYGQAADKQTESEVRAEILTSVEAITSGATVSFNSEEL